MNESVPTRQLLVLSCSDKKRPDPPALPALERYDGPYYRVIRRYLRKSVWPATLSVAVLSAKYGLIGSLAPIRPYDQRMNRESAERLKKSTTKTLLEWSKHHDRINLVLGKEYLRTLDPQALGKRNVVPQVAEGSIGMKQSYVLRLLEALERQPRPERPTLSLGRPLYFLPDWDDMLDRGYDFEHDRFSDPNKATRDQVHCTRLVDPQRMCDGILVSLAQHFGTNSRGVLRKFAETDLAALAPQPMHKKFGLSDNQWVFGDCGAFSYANKDEPDIKVEQALALYQLYGFDFGASVDHIPLPEINTPNGKVVLSKNKQYERIRLTKENARRFLELHKERKCSFAPVGVIQGLTSRSYSRRLPEYVEMGYQHVAIGGLVPRSDKEVLEIVGAISKAKAMLGMDELWIHLFGVYRPKIQRRLRESGVTSFDSATYFRKAWLRSDQNYLGSNKKWYAAVRVPVSSDPRTRKRLQSSQHSLDELEVLEKQALRALHEYGERRRSLDSTLQAIKSYDFLLLRSEDHGENLLAQYERTLKERPWEMCRCRICRDLGVDVVIFRGYNRNKRRGAHNTALLYRSVLEVD